MRNTSDSHVRDSKSWWWETSSRAIALALGLGLLVGLWLFSRPIGLVILGVSIAALFAPLVSWLERWMPRVLAVVLVYLLVVLALVGVFWVIIPPLVRQVQDFVSQGPNIIQSIQGFLDNLSSQFNIDLQSLFSSGLGGASALASFGLSFFTDLFDFLLIVFISIYMLVFAPSMREFALSLFPEKRQEDVRNLIEAISREMGGYLRGAVINGLIIGALTSAGLFLIGVNFPLVLGLLAGVFELIPMVGAIVAGLVMVAIALMQSLTKAIIALVFAIALHQFESQVLVPNIMRGQTDISPLMVIIALTAGYAVGGIFGAIVAIPLTAALRVLFLYLVVPEIRRRTGAHPGDEKEEIEEKVQEG
ncbi:MAG: AI-2E family transporter [Anaerolineales bacterium]|jgi:predicted PurR-regulated permease PerM